MTIARSPALMRLLMAASAIALALVVGATLASAQASQPVWQGPLSFDSPPDSGSAPPLVTLTSSLELRGSGYAPLSKVDLVMESTPRLLATVTADATGSFAATVTIPADAEVGSHTLKAFGVDASGASRVLSIPVTVADPATVAGPGTEGDLARTGASSTRPLALAGGAAIALGALIVTAVSTRRRTAETG